MWTRQQLKKRGKEAFKKNYWKTVLVSLIMTVLVGGAGSAGLSSASSGFSSGFSSAISNSVEGYKEAELADIEINIEEEDEIIQEQIKELAEASDGNLTEEQIVEILETLGVEVPDELGEDLGEESDFKMSDDDKKALAIITVVGMGLVFCVIFGILFLVVFVISLVVDILIVNPLQMGTQKFFLTNLNEKAGVKNVAFGFDHNYKNIVKTLFMRDLYVFLWSLLFIIPGVVKSYEYRMVPYLLAENPSMNFNEALVLSSKMMYGQKWKTFVLDLSFIGWNILSSLTSGLLGLFFVAPYQNMTNAALYEALKPNVEIPQQQIVYGLNSGETEH